ncbi:hypothetical protein SAMN04487949_0859 [Halogranum gelatinilyticum]|uniref:Uncharacterized protein n=1 Tax=Halogranum gelatinilyticum TaxID=660521 RepID=A0A1G9QHU8_9EURY|nr:hypothetical protein [Halogranum gelatinilyticum]SDM10341.1 hypothetical protein SAMN04487949_0859 [Halogranum gelatinilyticum]
MTEDHHRPTLGPFDWTEPRSLALLSGTVTGLAGAVAYFLVPLVTADYGAPGFRDTADVTSYVLEYFFTQSLLYHAGVLVLVPFATTAVALTVARRAGRGGRWTDAAVVIAVVVGPVVAIWLGAFVALVAIAFQALAIAIFGVPFAVVIATVLSAIVVIVVTVSAVGGYALVESVGPRPPE